MTVTDTSCIGANVGCSAGQIAGLLHQNGTTTSSEYGQARRTASITGACVALGIALDKLIREGKVPPSAWLDTVSAISLGIVKGEVLTDLDYNEDSGCEADTNFVVTGTGKLVEVQGTAEQAPFSPEKLQELTTAALRATKTLKQVQLETFRKLGVSSMPS